MTSGYGSMLSNDKPHRKKKTHFLASDLVFNNMLYKHYP